MPVSVAARSSTVRLLRLWVRIPLRSWMFVCCECCVLSGRGLCDELITRLQESYWLWCVVVCDLETSWMRRPWPTGEGGAVVPNKQTKHSNNQFYENQFGDSSISLTHIPAKFPTLYKSIGCTCFENSVLLQSFTLASPAFWAANLSFEL